MITVAEDIRGGTLQSEGAPLQPKTAFGENRVYNNMSPLPIVEKPKIFEILIQSPEITKGRLSVGVIFTLTKSPPQVQEYLINQHKPPLQSTKPRNRYPFPRYLTRSIHQHIKQLDLTLPIPGDVNSSDRGVGSGGSKGGGKG